MKTDSKLFDRIRINPRHSRPTAEDVPDCDWEGCDQPGLYKAPKGHRSDGQYHHFCLEHVRHYNAAFNFFAGMSDKEREANVYESAETAGRPSWSFGAKADYAGPRMPNRPPPKEGVRRPADPLHIFARYRHYNKNSAPVEREIKLGEPDRRAFEALGFTTAAKSDDIKRAYKTLVKIHHPDANGGDKASEERLRSIIAAYSHLKTKGFVAK